MVRTDLLRAVTAIYILIKECIHRTQARLPDNTILMRLCANPPESMPAVLDEVRIEQFNIC
jgi:hypothetical protein